ncbi:hypothetical protein FRC01_004090 [Tulasnella sp. 417]|nr:hypothetical protein FRC01_004090 [Tulasnella sp. 417]
MKRCGGEVLQINPDRSSVQKGETLADTIRTVGCYADAIVLRHPAVGSVQSAAKYSPVPVINAGDGIGEHPTQALLDVYTIRSELGTVNGKTITLLGDLKNGRTVHSLVVLLSFYSVRLNFVAPPSLKMPESVVHAAKRAGIPVHQCESLDEVLGETDVLYVTRVQQERFENKQEWEAVKDAYVINHAVMARAKEDMIVMHPLPRVNEIDPEVDFDSRRAVYFRQMRYGLFARIKKIMQKDDEVGKVAQATPVLISKSLELFMATLVDEMSKVTVERGCKRVEVWHLYVPLHTRGLARSEGLEHLARKAAIERTEMLDFLKEIVDPIQDPYPNGADEGAAGVGPDGKKKRGPRKKKEPVD